MKITLSRGSKIIFESIVFSRCVYALSWFVMAAAFPAMATVYNYHIRTLALFTSAFLVGAGTFQIPAGIYASKRSIIRPLTLGLAILTVTAALSAYSGEFYFQLVLRFLSGIGASFYFAPGLVLASTMIKGKSGLASGIYSSAFYFGGGLAVVAFTPIASLFGWRIPFVITAILTFVGLIQNVRALRVYSSLNSEKVAKIRRVLHSRSVWAVALGILGVSAINYVVTQFFISYSEIHLRYSPSLTGLASSLMYVGALIGGPLGGIASDHFAKRRQFIGLPAFVASISVLFFSLDTYVALLVGALLSGVFVSAAYSNAYVYPTQLGIDSDTAPLAVGLINSVGIMYGSIMAPLFSVLIAFEGFSTAWAMLTVISLASIPLIYYAREPPSR